MTQSTSNSVRPFLAAAACLRDGDPCLPGYHHASRDVWVVDGHQGTRPIVEIRNDLGQTSTTTRVLAEQDDSDVSYSALAGTSTFTKVLAEGDDTDVSCAGLLEVATKTNAQVEGEDVVYTIEAALPHDEENRTITRRIQ